MDKNSLRVKISWDSEYRQNFKALIGHPMDDGYRAYGPSKQADYIRQIQVRVDEVAYLSMEWNENISKNPFLAFRLSPPITDGQILTLSWIDNRNREISYDCVVEFDLDGRFLYHSEEHVDLANKVNADPANNEKTRCKNRQTQ